jgi:hypothetical protein
MEVNKMTNNQKLETNHIPHDELLARIVMGSLKSNVAFPSKKKTAISVKVESDLLSELEFFKEKSGKTMTDLVQLLLWIGVRDVRKHMELDGQLEIEGAKK